MSCSILNNPWNEDQWDALFWRVPWGWKQSVGQVAKEQLRRARVAGYIKNYIFRKIKCIKNVPTVLCKAWIYNLCVWAKLGSSFVCFSWHIWVLFRSYCDSMEVCVCVTFFPSTCYFSLSSKKKEGGRVTSKRAREQGLPQKCFHNATAMWTLSSV